MDRRSLIALTLALGTPPLAHAEGTSKAYGLCMEQAGGVTMDTINCISAEHEQQDLRLNQAYKALTARLTPERKAQLLEAQRLWLKYREANCNYIGSLTGGTMDSINSNACFLDMTVERADQLEWFADNEGFAE